MLKQTKKNKHSYNGGKVNLNTKQWLIKYFSPEDIDLIDMRLTEQFLLNMADTSFHKPVHCYTMHYILESTPYSFVLLGRSSRASPHQDAVNVLGFK